VRVKLTASAPSKAPCMETLRRFDHCSIKPSKLADKAAWALPGSGTKAIQIERHRRHRTYAIRRQKGWIRTTTSRPTRPMSISIVMAGQMAHSDNIPPMLRAVLRVRKSHLQRTGNSLPVFQAFAVPHCRETLMVMARRR
jgi:hypothetical protein